MFNYQGMNEMQVLEGVKKFGPAPGARKMINWEYNHALEALESKEYITYYCASKKTECARVGSGSKCFCGHLFSQHNRQGFSKKINISCQKCSCKRFQFIPSRPEFRMRNVVVTKKKRVQCNQMAGALQKLFKRCRHTHEEHMENPPYRCKVCQCQSFYCDFACISCDCRWEDHETLYETEYERKALQKPIGEAYLPLSSNTEIQQETFKHLQAKPLKNNPYQPIAGQHLQRVPAAVNHQNNMDFFYGNFQDQNQPIGNDAPFKFPGPRSIEYDQEPQKYQTQSQNTIKKPGKQQSQFDNKKINSQQPKKSVKKPGKWQSTFQKEEEPTYEEHKIQTKFKKK